MTLATFLAERRAKLGAATKAPLWAYEDKHVCSDGREGVAFMSECLDCGTSFDCDNAENDASAICDAMNSLPTLLAIIERQAEAIESIKKCECFCEDLHNQTCDSCESIDDHVAAVEKLVSP